MNALIKSIEAANQGGPYLDGWIAAWLMIPSVRNVPYSNYTTSMDAIKKLIEERLPGVDCVSGTMGPHTPGYFCKIWDDHPLKGDRWNASVSAATEELARCLALIEAIKAKQRA